ncbi:MAG: methylated-DNA--[protein]-cysteine S-methyltransferase [Deltaproteobacteria bacterium]|nr:MAG: methylated-DNA--[protein]-cysteine S-methyltransferase [Deltaproteobacteria bacterium]
MRTNESEQTLGYVLIPSPFREVAIVYCEKPFLLKKVFLPRANRQRLLEAIAGVGKAKPGSHPKALSVAETVKEYFNGKPLQPNWKYLDMKGLTALQKSVLRATADIPFGTVRSYKEIAEAIRRPRAYRFVGTALANNPFPLLIPCHRVIRSDASLGQFGGGADLKRKLIERETRMR